MLVTIDAPDAMGKSTLIESLKGLISSCAIFTKEPGSNHIPICQQLRSIALENEDLNCVERELVFYADASRHQRWISENSEKLIVSDRGLFSHLAYLRAYLKTGSLAWDIYYLLKKLISFTCSEPDYVVYVSGSIGLMNERQTGKKKDVIESNGEDYYRAVFDTYTDLVAERLSKGLKTLVIDASLPVDQNTIIVIDWLRKEGLLNA